MSLQRVEAFSFGCGRSYDYNDGLHVETLYEYHVGLRTKIMRGIGSMSMLDTHGMAMSNEYPLQPQPLAQPDYLVLSGFTVTA